MSSHTLLLLVVLSFSLSLFSSCEDVIEVPLESAETALVVDAWISDQDRVQIIRLSLSQAYFDNEPPISVKDASVNIIRSDGSIIPFEHNIEGRYFWRPQETPLGQVGDEISLQIDYDQHQYTATAIINRVPTIDSIGIEYKEKTLLIEEGMYAQFYARDFAGKGDTYWIKTFRNGEFLDKPLEMNIAFDAGFDAGTGIDGLVFIPPIREAVNALNEDDLQSPYKYGDEIRVELHSISNTAFRFLETARDQITNGNNGIFSIPLANTRTNITSPNGLPVLGFFNVASVSSHTLVLPE